MIVVDSNVVAYLYLPGDYTAKAEALLEDDADWAAPLLWRSEFRNILAGFLRRRAVTFDQACRLQREAESLLAGSEYEVDSPGVLELVRDSDCSAYDCEFVARACADICNCPAAMGIPRHAEKTPHREPAIIAYDGRKIPLARGIRDRRHGPPRDP